MSVIPKEQQAAEDTARLDALEAMSDAQKGVRAWYCQVSRAGNVTLRSIAARPDDIVLCVTAREAIDAARSRK
jgi:hypothetical protein